MVDQVGQQFGNYHLTRLLGKGGFAEVYLGQHVHLNTSAAIKILQTHVVGHEVVESFRREAYNTMSQLIHPHIVRTLDFGIEKSTPFIVMDYAPHGSLRDLHGLRSRLPLSTIVAYVKDVAAALQYAHVRQCIHRDVKPANMLVGRNNDILLGDFGVATILQSTRYSSNNDIAGTITYMAPEQLQGHACVASDQYALAVVVYEWLCGQLPFTGNFAEIGYKHVHVEPPPVSGLVPVSQAVEDVIHHALAKDPGQRFSDVQSFAEALEAVYIDEQRQQNTETFVRSTLKASQKKVHTTISLQPDNQPLLSETVEAISDDAFLPATVEAGNLLQSTEQVAILSEPEESTEAFVPSFWEKTFALLVPKNKLWLNMLLIVGYATLFMTITISMADPQMFAKGYHGDLFSSVSALTFIIIPTGIMLAGKLLGVWRGTLSILLCIAFTWRLVVFYHLPFGVDQADLNRTIIGIVITTFVVGLLWLGISKFITMDNDNKPENASDKETANCLLISISPAITLVGTALLWGILSRSFDFWGIVQWLLVTILSAIGVSILEWVVFMVLGILRMVLFTLYRVVSTYKSK